MRVDNKISCLRLNDDGDRVCAIEASGKKWQVGARPLLDAEVVTGVWRGDLRRS